MANPRRPIDPLDVYIVVAESPEGKRGLVSAWTLEEDAQKEVGSLPNTCHEAYRDYRWRYHKMELDPVRHG